MSHNVAEIVSNPEAYGFTWGSDILHKDGKALGQCPYVIHRDLPKMREIFGDEYFLASANGTSRRVTDQRIARDLRWEDLSTKDDVIKTAIVQNMLGQISRRRGGVKTVTVTVETFKGLDGENYATELEMKQGNLAFMVGQGLPVDQAKIILGITE
jgi:hypothetical protein